MYSGSIIGLALSPQMVSRLQWPSVFYIFGFIGIFWFLAWEKNASSSPAIDNKIGKEERDYITSQTIKQVQICRTSLHMTSCSSQHAEVAISVTATAIATVTVTVKGTGTGTFALTVNEVSQSHGHNHGHGHGCSHSHGSV